MRLEIGQIYGDKYRILRRIGEGAMGAVYEGENVRIHRRVAIKTLHGGVASKADTITRFEREAQAAGRIGSEHIVEVLDMGELDDGTRFMVMEFLEGVTLSQRIRSKGRLSPDEACTFLVELLEGLAGAHQAGIIHRDLKPANVFLLHSKSGQADFVKILDFGVSKFSLLGGEEMSMTSTGAVLGTPFYMSPEQAKGSASIDHRSDLYTVGVIAYECVTGQVPYAAETFNELLFKIVLESPPPAESFVPDLDPGFAAILRKAMAREPGDRYQTAEELSRTFQEFLARPKAAGGAPLPQQHPSAPRIPAQAQTPPPAPVHAQGPQGPQGPPPAPQVATRPGGFGGAAGGRPPPPRPAAGMPAPSLGMHGTMAMPDGVPGGGSPQAPTVRPPVPPPPPPPAAGAPPLGAGFGTPPPAQSGYGPAGAGAATQAVPGGFALQGLPYPAPMGAPPGYPQQQGPQQGYPQQQGPQQGYPQQPGMPGGPSLMQPTPAPGAGWGEPGQPGADLHETAEIPGVSGGNRKIGVAMVLIAAVLLGGGTAAALRWRSGQTTAKANVTASAPVAAPIASTAATATATSTASAAASVAVPAGASSAVAPVASASAAPAATSAVAATTAAPTASPAPVAAAVGKPWPRPAATSAPSTSPATPTPAPKGTGTAPQTKGRTISSEL